MPAFPDHRVLEEFPQSLLPRSAGQLLPALWPDLQGALGRNGVGEECLEHILHEGVGKGEEVLLWQLVYGVLEFVCGPG